LGILATLQIRGLSSTFSIPRVLAACFVMAILLMPVYGQAAPANPHPFGIGLELMTDPEGVDFTAFIKQVYKSVKDKAVATMPKSVAQGDQGVVSIRVQIQKDGTLASPALPKFKFSSGKKALDDNAMAAVIKAAPFDHLPEQFSGPSVELQLTFYYNLPPPSSR
jgi:TonB family protein